ncbi:MAG: putative phosphonopyruvate decarboxylase or sulfopyruvate decarboxylase, alpha subunit [Acidobacteria bacterium]|nr:putative phosphonopyruvate decarboxylase or sulfopyruvate decarboxylase, alpha subunit [Acidobacteriota bacterium]
MSLRSTDAVQSLPELLHRAGFDFFTGVPDSTLEPALRELEARPELGYVPAVSEQVAVGLAAGAWLGGKRPVVLMQNTGLALALHPLATLIAIYRIPLLLVVGWRGHGGNDAPEHRVIGEATLPLLEALRVPFFVPDTGTLAADLHAAASTAQAQQGAAVLLIRPKVLAC